MLFYHYKEKQSTHLQIKIGAEVLQENANGENISDHFFDGVENHNITSCTTLEEKKRLWP